MKYYAERTTQRTVGSPSAIEAEAGNATYHDGRLRQRAAGDIARTLRFCRAPRAGSGLVRLARGAVASNANQTHGRLGGGSVRVTVRLSG